MAHPDEFTVFAHRGAGQVGRAPRRVVVVFAPVIPQADLVLALRHCDDADLVAAKMPADADTPPYALVATSGADGDGQVAVFARGPVEIDASGPTGEIAFSVEAGRNAAYALPLDCTTLSVRPVGTATPAPEDCLALDRDGVVSGGGVTVSRVAPDPSEADAAVPAAAEVVGAAVEPVVDTAETGVLFTGSVGPEPVTWATRRDTSARVTPPPMITAPLETPADAARPVSPGRLVVDTGHSCTLDSSWVIGREPQLDVAVQTHRARAMRLSDPYRHVSRVHAQVDVVDGDGVRRVVLTDRSSANGTFVEPPGTTGWVQLQPNAATELVGGSRFRIGEYTFRYETD